MTEEEARYDASNDDVASFLQSSDFKLFMGFPVEEPEQDPDEAGKPKKEKLKDKVTQVDLPDMPMDDDTPQPPFYDNTLNFLWHQVRRLYREKGKTEDRIIRANIDLEVTNYQLEDARKVFVHEFNGREVINPQTGEVIDFPAE